MIVKEIQNSNKVKFIRYPGGKQRLLGFILPHLPMAKDIKGHFVEPFVGSGSVFFAIKPDKAKLSDINPELIDLYKGIKKFPLKVWNYYKNFPSSKKGYYKVRDKKVKINDLAYRSARILYLNRTCFKGMWRHNSIGKFNVGYGGQDRRWVINQTDLVDISSRLSNVKLECSDFEKIIESCTKDDFIFLDPPYKPGEKEIAHEHYTFSKFKYEDYERLSNVLSEATNKGISWAMTISSHSDILTLFDGFSYKLKKGTGKKPGILTNKSGEILICNY